MKKALIVLALVGLGYAAGAVAPASAYTQDPYRVLNSISSDIRGIRNALQSIERKMR